MWIFDLIEPYWNVKTYNFDIAKRSVRDLIEPYWNVKSLEKITSCIGFCGFNRTILECKEHFLYLAESKKVQDLIEPYWNVKVPQ